MISIKLDKKYNKIIFEDEKYGHLYLFCNFKTENYENIIERYKTINPNIIKDLYDIAVIKTNINMGLLAGLKLYKNIQLVTSIDPKINTLIDKIEQLKYFGFIMYAAECLNLYNTVNGLIYSCGNIRIPTNIARMILSMPNYIDTTLLLMEEYLLHKL